MFVWKGQIILNILTHLCFTFVHCTNEKFKNQIDYLQGVGSIRMILRTSREFQLTVKIKEPLMISEHSDI